MRHRRPLRTVRPACQQGAPPSSPRSSSCMGGAGPAAGRVHGRTLQPSQLDVPSGQTVTLTGHAAPGVDVSSLLASPYPYRGAVPAGTTTAGTDGSFSFTRPTGPQHPLHRRRAVGHDRAADVEVDVIGLDDHQGPSAGARAGAGDAGRVPPARPAVGRRDGPVVVCERRARRVQIRARDERVPAERVGGRAEDRRWRCPPDRFSGARASTPPDDQALANARDRPRAVPVAAITAQAACPRGTRERSRSPGQLLIWPGEPGGPRSRWSTARAACPA